MYIGRASTSRDNSWQFMESYPTQEDFDAINPREYQESHFLAEQALLNTQDEFNPRITTSSSIKRNQTKKKLKNVQPSSSKYLNEKIDIRAKLSNDSDNHARRYLSVLLDSVRRANSAKQCYFCQYVYLKNCLKLQRQKHLAFGFNETSDMPDVNLIDNINRDLLSQYVKSMSDSESFSGNEKQDEMENENRKNFDLQLEILSENEDDNEGENVEMGFVPYRELDNNNESNMTLEYFGLGSIDDLFSECDDDKSVIFIENSLSEVIDISSSDSFSSSYCPF